MGGLISFCTNFLDKFVEFAKDFLDLLQSDIVIGDFSGTAIDVFFSVFVFFLIARIIANVILG